MSGFLEVVLSAYGVKIKSVRQLRGGAKLLDLFSICASSSPQENFRRLKVHLRTYFPQLESTLCVTKCARGEPLELSYVAALSVGALIAQDLSKASSASHQSTLCLPERLRNLCAYQGAEVESIKEFCEIVFKDDDVPGKIRKLLSTWIDTSENDISTSSGSSLNSSLHNRTPLSPLNVVLRTPENRLRVREKYNQEVVKLRGDLMMMRERYDHLEADTKQHAEAKDREVKELQNRVRILREMIDAETQEARNPVPNVQNEISIGRLKMLQKQVQQLQDYEQKFFDEKFRAEELETKLLQDEKKIKDLKTKIQTLEATIFERDEELSQAADEMGALRDRLEEQRADISLIRHRNQSHDTLESLPEGENLGDAVQDLLVAELRTTSDELRDQLESAKQQLSTKTVEIADLQLSNQMMKEQLAELEAQVDTLRGQIRSHLETISQAAAQANELSTKLQSAQNEADRLRSELEAATSVKEKLEERRKYLENKIQMLKSQIEETQSRFVDMDRIKSLIEEQFKAQSTVVEDLRAQLAEKTARISSVESELSKATSGFTETVKSLNTQLGDDRKNHVEEKSKLEGRLATLEQDLAESNLQRQTLYSEIEKLKSEHAEIHTQLNIHLESQSKMKREISTLENKLRLEEEAKKTFETSFTQAMEEIRSLQSSNEQLKSEVKQRTKSEESVKKQLEQDQKSLAESQRSLKILEDNNRNLKKSYIASCTELEEVKEHHEFRSKEYEQLKQLTAKLETIVDEQMTGMSALESKIREMKDALATEAADKAFMQDTLNQASATIAENDNVIDEQQQKLKQIENEMNALRALLDSKENELADARGVQDDLRKSIETAEAEVATLTEQSEQREKAVDAKITEIKQQLTSAQNELSSARDQLKQLQETAEILEREKTQLIERTTESKSEVERCESELNVCRKELTVKSERVIELEQMLSESQTKLCTAEELHEREIQTFSSEATASKERQAALELQIEELREESALDKSRHAEFSEKIALLEKEIDECKEKKKICDEELESIRSTLQEALSEKESLNDDVKNSLAKIERVTNELELESDERRKLTTELSDLKLEHAKLLAEISELRLRNTNAVPVAEAVQWKSFRKDLVDKLEKLDVQAPVMSDEQLLAILDETVDTQKKLKELQIENQNLSRLARNAEDNVKCRIMELTADNDQLKRKLRESSSELNRFRAELNEITATVIRAKTGDTVDGGILNPVCRDIMNMAIMCQENVTTKKEITELRLTLNESRREKERLESNVTELKNAVEELDRIRDERDKLRGKCQTIADNMKLTSDSQKQHDQSMELMKEGYDLEVNRLRMELHKTNMELSRARTELKNSQEYVSTLLDKYDKTKEYSLRKISGLHDIIYQNNIPLAKPRRKSPNQPGPCLSSRPSEAFGDDLEAKLREKDEEIRRLRLTKQELEKRVCASTISEREAAGIMNVSSNRSLASLERQRMPPPLYPAGDCFRDRYSYHDDRAWREFRDPNKLSGSTCSDYDSFSVKSMPVAYRQEQNSMHRSFSSRSLLFDHDTSRYGERSQVAGNLPRTSTCVHRGASCLSTCKFVPHEEDFPSPPAMNDKPLPAHADPRLSNAFESISELNYKCDLDTSYTSSRGGRSVGLGGLGLGDDEEAQFMNPKNLEDLKNGGPPPSPQDPNRVSELRQRNSQVPPHLQSSYPVETQNGKIPVTPILQKKRFK